MAAIPAGYVPAPINSTKMPSFEQWWQNGSDRDQTPTQGDRDNYNLIAAGVKKYGGYGGHKTVESLIDQYGVQDAEGNVWVPPQVVPQIINYGNSLSVDPISPEMAFGAFGALAGGTILSGLAGAGGAGSAVAPGGAFEMGGLTGTGIPEAWGITGTAPTVGGLTELLNTVPPGTGTVAQAVAGAGAGSQLDMSELGSGEAGMSGPAGNPSYANTSGVPTGTGAAASGLSALSSGADALKWLTEQTGLSEAALKALGIGAQAALGIASGLQQSNATSNLGDRILNMGAPSLARYEASFAPGFDLFSEGSAYKGALDSSWDSALRKLSATGGNPFDNKGGLIEANKAITSGIGLPALQNYRETNRAAGFGNVPQYAQLQQNAIGQQGGAWEAAAAGLESLLNPRQNYKLVLG